MKHVLTLLGFITALSAAVPGQAQSHNPNKFSHEECTNKVYVGAGANWNQAADLCNQRRDKAYISCLTQRYDADPFATFLTVTYSCSGIKLLPEDQMIEDCFNMIGRKMSESGAQRFCEWSQSTGSLILPKCVNLNYYRNVNIDDVVASCYTQYQRGELNQSGQNKRVLEQQRLERERIAAEEKRRQDEARRAAELKRQEQERKAQERLLEEQRRKQERARAEEKRRLEAQAKAEARAAAEQDRARLEEQRKQAAATKKRQEELARLQAQLEAQTKAIAQQQQKPAVVKPVPPQAIPEQPVQQAKKPQVVEQKATTPTPVPPQNVPVPLKKPTTVLPAPAEQRPSAESLEAKRQAAAKAEAEKKKKEEEERKKKEEEEKAKLAVPLLPDNGSGVITDLPNFE